MLADTGGQSLEEIFSGLRIAPATILVAKVISPRTRGKPDFLKRFLQVHHDLAPVSKRERNHATHSLIVDIGVGGLIKLVAAGLDPGKQGLGKVQIFKVGHYNLQIRWSDGPRRSSRLRHAITATPCAMHTERTLSEPEHCAFTPFKGVNCDFERFIHMLLMPQLARILTTAFALPLIVGMLAACGQKGPLFIPDTAPAAGRATLPQTVFGQPERPSATTAPTGTTTPASTPGNLPRPRALPNLPETQ